jgi:hypothetical protein
LSCYKPPYGTSVIVAIKVGSSYANSTQVTTASLSSGAYTSTTTTSITLSAGQYVYADITQTGPQLNPGYGLAVTLNYYSG